MSGFLQLAKKRKTTYEFSSKKVADSKISKVLESARWAPSTANIQPWYFIVVKNQKMISNLLWSIPYAHYPFVNPSPNVMIVFVLPKDAAGKELKVTKDKELSSFNAHSSLGMSALNALYAATDLGLASCLLTPARNEVRKLLSIPKGDIPYVVVGIGYEKKGGFAHPRKRKELKSLVYKEKYGKR